MHTDVKFRIEFAANGRLLHMEDWNEEVTILIARNDGMTLTQAHWEVLRVMRDYYQRYNITPIMKLLKKALTENLGADKATDEYLDRLFPTGVTTQGSKIAGLPEPHLDAEIEHRYAPTRHLVSTTAAPPPATIYFQHQFEFKGKIYKVYEKGNLVDLGAWNEEVAEFMAQKEGITLTPAHWDIIHYLRKFYLEYGITPMVRILMKYAREELGPEKSKRTYLYSLFPKGPSRQGSRIAGLPEPQGCLDD